MKKAIIYFWNSSTLTAWGDSLVASLKFLIVTPFILRYFSVEEIVIWYLFASVIIFFSLFNFGFSPTLIRFTSYIRGGATDLSGIIQNKENKKNKTDWNIMEKMYSNISFIFLFLSILVFLLMITIGSLIVKRNINLIDNNLQIWLSWLFICVGTSINFYGFRFRDLLLGLNRIALVNRWKGICNLLNLFFSLLVVTMKPSILMLIFVQQFFMFINIMINRFFLFKENDRAFKKMKSFDFDKKMMKSIWRPSWRLGLQSFSAQGVSQGGGIILSQFSTPLLIASYLFSIQIITFIYSFSQIPFSVNNPYYSKLRAQGRIKKLKNISDKKTIISLFCFLFISCLVGIFINNILLILKSNIIFVSDTIWILIIMIWFYDLYIYTRVVIYNTTNNIVYYKHYILSGILYLVMLLSTIKILDIMAIILSHLISRALVFNYKVSLMSLKTINDSFSSHFKKIILPSFIFLLIVIFLVKII